MKIIKPDNLGLLFSPFMGEELVLSIAVLAYFTLETDVSSRLMAEADMWPAVASELGEEEALDSGFPKPRGEFLVYGSACSTKPVQGLHVQVEVHDLVKSLVVTGPRVWGLFGQAGEPEPFTHVRLTYHHAFGGPGFDLNPLGLGISPGLEGLIPVPLIQDMRTPVTSPQDRPDPAGFTAYPPDWPQRRKHLGAFDETWLQQRWPHLPSDTSREYFNTAPEDQRLYGFFTGNETVKLTNMNLAKAVLESTLPGVRARLFINRSTAEGEKFVEVEAKPETLWLFPGRETGLLLFRGVTPVADEELDDVLHLVADWELLSETPQPAEYYHQVLLQTATPAQDETATPVEAPAAVPAVQAPQPDQTPRPDHITSIEPPLSPEAEKLVADLKNEVAAAEKQVEDILNKHGLTREEAMKKFAPPAEAAEPVGPEGLKKLVAEAEKQAEDIFKKAGLTREAAMQKFVPPAEPEVPVDPKSLVKEIQGAMSQAWATLANAGVSSEQAEKLFMPQADPGTLSAPPALDKLAADLDKAMALTPPATQKIAPPLTPTQWSPLTRDEVMARYRAGQRLSNLDLSELDFTGQDLSGADFSEAILVNTIFRHAILAGANFEGAVAVEADFSQCVLGGARLARIQAGAARFAQSALSGTFMGEGDFSGADFTGAIMAGADMSAGVFVKAKLNRTKLSRAKAIRADFSGADLTLADFRSSDLTEADFSGTDITDTVLAGVHAPGLRLEGTVGKNIDLSHAVLVKSRADNSTSFFQIDLSGADLSQSCWEGVQLTEARLAEAHLDQADFSRAVFADSFLVNSTLKETTLLKVKFEKCDLRGANFFKASLRQARFTLCDLNDSHFFGADLYGTVIQQCRADQSDFKRTIAAIRTRTVNKGKAG